MAGAGMPNDEALRMDVRKPLGLSYFVKDGKFDDLFRDMTNERVGGNPGRMPSLIVLSGWWPIFLVLVNMDYISLQRNDQIFLIYYFEFEVIMYPGKLICMHFLIK